MKSGYKRLLIFLSFIVIVLLANSFLLNFLSGYKITVFILVLFAIFHKVFVFERDRHRYLEDLIFEVFLFIMTFFILYYLIGLISGLARIPNYYTVNGIFGIILPIILYTIVREIFRYNMLCKADDSRICTIGVILVFILFDLSNNLFYLGFDSQYGLLRFVALLLLPAISENICYSYITKRTGYIPIIVFELIMTLYPYLIPIIPNPSEYVVSIIYLIIPVLFALRIGKFFNLKKDDRIPSDYHKRKYRGILGPALIVLAMVYFYSGYFRFYAIAIAGNSMTPNLRKGDIVIVDQKYRDLEVGDVIAFRQNKVIIVHRIIKIVEIDDEYFYYTQGDANNHMDDLVIDKDMVIGKTINRIPLVGYPTVWFGEM